LVAARSCTNRKGGNVALRPRMIELGVRLRNPAGQFASPQPLPPPRDMQAAYPSGGALGIARPAATVPSERDLAAAAGTVPQAKYPRGLGRAAKAETAEIGDAVSMFIRNYKR